MSIQLIAPLVTIPCVLLSIVPLAKAGEIGGISPAVFDCMKAPVNLSSDQGRIEYRGDNSGKIHVFSNAFGEVGTVDFNYNPDTLTLSNATYIPFVDLEQRTQEGLQITADKCRAEVKS